MHLKGAGGTQTLPAAVSPVDCCGTMETVPCFVLAQHFGPGLGAALQQPLVAAPGAAVPALGAASAPAAVEGPWRGKPCRVALLLLQDCCFFSRLTDKAKTDT